MYLKVLNCEIMISWILMIFIFISWSLYMSPEAGNKYVTFFTDGLDTGHSDFATACAVYASNLLPCAHYTLAIGCRMRSLR
jgi:hypothetical protein